MAKKTKTQLDFDLRARKIDRLAAFAETAVKYGALTTIFGFVYGSIRVLAGQSTFADIGIRFLTDFRVSETLAWGFGVGGAVYGLRQRNLRRKTIERLAGQVKDKELALDPDRSSSRLSATGTTRPEDLKR